MTVTHATCDASQAVKLADIRDGRELWFPSPGSLEWHFRRHKSRYAREGALLIIRGAVFVDPNRFDAIFNAIAREQAMAQLGGQAQGQQVAA